MATREEATSGGCAPRADIDRMGPREHSMLLPLGRRRREAMASADDPLPEEITMRRNLRWSTLSVLSLLAVAGFVGSADAQLPPGGQNPQFPSQPIPGPGAAGMGTPGPAPGAAGIGAP